MQAAADGRPCFLPAGFSPGTPGGDGVRRHRRPTTFSAPAPQGVKCSVGVKLDVRDFDRLTPAQVAAFLAGVAEVVAAGRPPRPVTLAPAPPRP